MSIISIQSHVAYGYVGNKAAVYPLQYMGYDVWLINTVQFSNHTGYGKWQREIFTAKHIKEVVQGIKDIGKLDKCQAVLTGYMGSMEICQAVKEIVNEIKSYNRNVIYLCDPVIGNNSCYVKPEVLEFFKSELSADIITPNQYEAEILSGIKIRDIASLQRIANYFHERGIKIVIVTGISFPDKIDKIYTFCSNIKEQLMLQAKARYFSKPISGTGDLLSSLFLGHYLKSKDISSALQHTVYYLQKVLENTHDSQENELQVLSINYNELQSSELSLPSVIKL